MLKTIALLLLCASFAQAQTAHQSLREGDRAYGKKEFGAAEKAYRDALAKAPTDAATLYNTGNAAYRQGNYTEAANLYADAAQRSATPALKAAALHNLGNAHLKQGQYRPAVEAYENSLRLRPGDPGTKGNLQLAKKKLKEEEQQKQQKPEQKPEDQPNKSQGQDPQEQSGQSEQDPQEPNPSQPSDQNQPQNQPGPGEEQPDPARITPEQARRQLETAVGPADQKSARRYRENQRRPDKPRTKKDW